VKLKRLFIASIFVLCASATVRADGIPTDGIVRVGHGTDPAVPDSCHKTTFTVQLNGHGGGIENCFNSSGQDWFGLDITAQIPVGDTVNCVTDFSQCSFTVTGVGNSGKEKVDVLLTGGIIPSSAFDTLSSEFFINLNNSGSSPIGAGGWFGVDDGKLNGVVKVRAITPEPSAAVLLLVGSLGVLCFWRRG
jgi:hypothetical protein